MFFLSGFFIFLSAQKIDSAGFKPAVISPRPALDTVIGFSARPGFIPGNKLLNEKAEPVSNLVFRRNAPQKDALFYLVAGLVLLLALLRFNFPRYFNNLFRVFFNTSLRQSQLTDQLIMARLPSLLFNLFFILSGGLFIYLLLYQLHWINEQLNWGIAGICVGLIGITYGVKFLTLKFTGWLTGYHEMVNTYIFVVFLICKIIGVFLLPFLILLSFADPAIVKVAVTLSILVTGFMLVLRFFRSYGILQNKLKISRFHFLLYILGIEILPLLLIYKGLMVLLGKNL